MHAETVLTPADLIWPLFVTEGDAEEPIGSLPGVSRWSVADVAKRAKEAAALGIPCVALYPVRIGFALGLEPLLGGDALWWSFPVGSAAALGLAAAYFRWGNWRKGALIRPREAEEQSLATSEPAGRLQPTG